MAVFPPPGLSCDDSYFARVIPLEEKPGRLYVGYLAPNLKRQYAMSPLAAALLTAPEVRFQDHKDREDLLGPRSRVALSSGRVKKSIQQMESEGKKAELTDLTAKKSK